MTRLRCEAVSEVLKLRRKLVNVLEGNYQAGSKIWLLFREGSLVILPHWKHKILSDHKTPLETANVNPNGDFDG